MALTFKVEKASTVVGFGKAFKGAFLVLKDADAESARDSDVEDAGGASEDVGVTVFHGFSLQTLLIRNDIVSSIK
jgi:hypothetical protein